MSMLAGPRRKQKIINLRAKSSEWSKDNNKFGQRMLEKMGWSAGKGLGANENGIVEHVVAKYKNDEKGLGFEDRNDQWTQHEDDFNSLLANLSNGNDDTQIKLHSGISLEVKSKKSKARIHYHKFTRGKDLSRYSEKDLANIFGKKSFKEKREIEKPLDNDLKTTEREQVFTEKGSMEDYFKNKMAAVKSKSNISRNKNEKRDSEDEADFGFHGFSGTANNDIVSENLVPLLDIMTDNFEHSKIEKSAVDLNKLENLPKTKKKKKKKCREETQEELSENNQDNMAPEPQEKPKRKQKRDIKNAGHVEDIDELEGQMDVKKHKQEAANSIQESDTEEIVHKPKKKKKRKNKQF